MSDIPNRKTIFSRLAALWGRSEARRHIFICEGPNCCTREQGIESHRHLLKKVKEEGLDAGDERVHCEKTACLGVCGNGPIAIVYPEMRWYERMNPTRLDRVIREHLKEGRVVEDFTFEPPPEARRPRQK